MMGHPVVSKRTASQTRQNCQLVQEKLRRRFSRTQMKMEEGEGQKGGGMQETKGERNMILEMEVSIQVISVRRQKSGSMVVRGSCSITQMSTADVPFFLSALGRSPHAPVISFAHGASGFPPFCWMGRVPEGRVRRILPSPGPVRLLFLRG